MGAHPLSSQAANINFLSFVLLNLIQNVITPLCYAAGTGPFLTIPNPRATVSGYNQKSFIDEEVRPGVTEDILPE